MALVARPGVDLDLGGWYVMPKDHFGVIRLGHHDRFQPILERRVGKYGGVDFFGHGWHFVRFKGQAAEILTPFAIVILHATVAS